MEYFKPTIDKLFAALFFSLVIFSIIQLFVMPLPIFLCPGGPCYNLRFVLVGMWFMYFVVGYIIYCCIIALIFKTKRHIVRRKKNSKRRNSG